MGKNFKVLTILLVSVLLFSACGKKEEVSKKIEKITSVETIEAKKQNLQLKTQISSKIEAQNIVNISPKISEKVVSLNIKIGDRVSKGQVLFTQDTASVSKRIESLSTGVSVAQAQLKQTMERIDTAKADYQRMKTLYEQGAISKKELEGYELSASDTNIEIAKLAVKQAQDNLSQANLDFRDAVVTTPISGIVTSVDIEQGELASPAKPVITITNMDEVIAKAELSEYLVNQIDKSKPVDVLIESADNKHFQGKITSFIPAAQEGKYSYPIEIKISNPKFELKPGMFVKLGIITKEKNNVITIPSESVLTKEGKTFVYLVENFKAIKREVKLGLDDSNQVEIIDGIKENEIVIVKGQNYVEENKKVKIVKSPKKGGEK